MITTFNHKNNISIFGCEAHSQVLVIAKVLVIAQALVIVHANNQLFKLFSKKGFKISFQEWV